MSSFSRRGALAMAGVALAVPKVGQAAIPPLPQPTDPVRTFVRLHSSIGGEVRMLVEGILYGRTPGALPKRLCGYRSILAIRGSEIEPGVFRTEQREVTYYHDLETGAPITRFVNPYTQEELVPVGYVTAKNVYFFDKTGSYARALPAQRSGKFDLDWRYGGGEVCVTESRFNTFPAGISEAEFPRAYAGNERRSVDILSYRAPLRDVSRRSSAIPASVSMTTDGPWVYWLMMGRAEGGVLWVGGGRKYQRFSDMPAIAVDGAEATYPGFIADPWGMSETEFGTGAQLRRLKAAGRIR